MHRARMVDGKSSSALHCSRTDNANVLSSNPAIASNGDMDGARASYSNNEYDVVLLQPLKMA